jgi:hypothetical protein
LLTFYNLRTGLPQDVFVETDHKALRKQDKRQAAPTDRADGTDRPDWTVPVFRYTSKVSRQVLRFFKHCFLKPASPALYERELRPMLFAYLCNEPDTIAQSDTSMMHALRSGVALPCHGLDFGGQVTDLEWVPLHLVEQTIIGLPTAR